MRAPSSPLLHVAGSILSLGFLGCADATRPASLSLVVSPDSVVVSLRDSVRVASRLLTASGESLPTRPTAWIVFDTSVATATPTGVVRGLKVGGTSLAVASEGVVTTVPVAVVTGFQTVVAGGGNAVALAEDSVAYTWGDTATAVPGEDRFASVSSGGSLSCALTAAGAVHCWGAFVPLGNGQDRSDAPVRVAPTALVRSLSVGMGFACAVTVDGVVWCWGMSYQGVTGPDGAYSTPYPVRIPFSEGVVLREVSAGGSHVCALSTTGTAWCWGYARYGQLGVDPGTLAGCQQRCSLTPVAVTGGLSFASITAGTTHTCGITTSGSAYCWGDNFEGELGDTLTSPCSYYGTPCSWAPVPVRAETPLVSLTAGSFYTCGLTAAHTAFCWGSNAGGVFGNGTVDWSSVPVPAALGVTWESLSAGSGRTCGRSTDGIVYCWGGGSLGCGPRRGSRVPERVWFQR